MSLIFGINLCDRLYLSADTRLSRRESGKIIETKDKIMKVVPFTDNIVGAFAGDAKLASFVARSLRKKIDPRLDIRKFQENIREQLGPLVDEHWRTVDPHAKIAVIFGGINRNERKKLPNMKKIYDKVMNYSKMEKQGQSMNMKPALFNEFLRSAGQPIRYPEPADSHIFGLEIGPPLNFKIEEAGWSEFLAYGPKGIRKESVDPIIFGKLEFEYGAEGNGGKDFSIITAILKSVAEKNKAEGVGGPFSTIMIDENTIGLLAGRVDRVNLKDMKSEFVAELEVIDGIPHGMNENGKSEKLVSLIDFESFGALNL